MHPNSKIGDKDEGEEEPAKPIANIPKTPVSILQELYVRKGITPKYDLVLIEGTVHEPTFKYRVRCLTLICYSYFLVQIPLVFKWRPIYTSVKYVL